MKKLCITTVKELVAEVDYSKFETICDNKNFRGSKDIIEMIKHHLPAYDKHEVKPFEGKIFFYKFVDIITVSDEKA